jgi:hypothetical protein
LKTTVSSPIDYLDQPRRQKAAKTDLLRNGEVVDAAGGVATGAGGAEVTAGHVGLGAGAEKESVFSGL